MSAREDGDPFDCREGYAGDSWGMNGQKPERQVMQYEDGLDEKANWIQLCISNGVGGGFPLSTRLPSTYCKSSLILQELNIDLLQ